MNHALQTFKPDYEEARRHWEAFWAGEILDRPCISVGARKDGAPEVPGPIYTEGHDGKYAEVAARAEASIAAHYWGGDAIPRYVPSFGPDMFAGFIGSELEYAPDTHTSWALPFVQNWKDALPLRLKNDGIWPRMQEFMAFMAQAARGRWVVSHIDMHSNMDALSAIRSPERICMDLLDEPESIDQAMKDVRAIYPVVTDALYKAGNMAATGSMGWIGMYCETKFNVTQCDFICMIGNDMFRRFVLPALAEETEHVGHSVYHLDGPGALRHLDDLLALPKLNAIQWVPGAGNKPLPEWLEVLQKIQAAGKSLHVYGSVEEIKFMHRKLDPRRCFYDCWAKNEAEARGIVEWLKKNT